MLRTPDFCIFDSYLTRISMQVDGKLISILPEVKGEGRNGPWKKQEFILETEENYPRKICISNWNDRIELSQELLYRPVKIDVTVESREYNGRWYTELRAVSMEVEKKETTDEGTELLPDRIVDVPDEIGDTSSANEGVHLGGDDLPF